jgi:hypothetical protein
LRKWNEMIQMALFVFFRVRLKTMSSFLCSLGLRVRLNTASFSYERIYIYMTANRLCKNC